MFGVSRCRFCQFSESLYYILMYLSLISKLFPLSLIMIASWTGAGVKMLVVDVWAHRQKQWNRAGKVKEVYWVWLQGQQRALNQWSQTRSRRRTGKTTRTSISVEQAGSLTKAESLTLRLQWQNLYWNYNERQAGTTQHSCSVFYTCDFFSLAGTGGRPVVTAARRDSRMDTNRGWCGDQVAGIAGEILKVICFTSQEQTQRVESASLFYTWPESK